MQADEHEAGERLRAELEDMTKSRGGLRSPLRVELRRRAVEHAQRAKRRGVSFAQTARELGVNLHTLHSWREVGGMQAKFKRVQLEASGPSLGLANVVVHGRHGVRIEGLDVARLAELLTRLG